MKRTDDKKLRSILVDLYAVKESYSGFENMKSVNAMLETIDEEITRIETQLEENDEHKDDD